MPKVIPNGPSALPPAGHSRDEELRRRADALDEAIEIEAANTEVESMNPKAFEPINEIQQAFNDQTNELEVSNPDPAYVYCWVNAGQHGIFIKMKTAQRWEVVQGDDPEAIEHRGLMADTTRRVGDCILMRIRKDFYRIIKKRQEEASLARLGATSAGLRELGEKYRDLGVRVKTSEDGTMDEATLRTMNTRAAAQKVAGQVQDKWLKTGTMPGMPAPGTNT